MLFYLCRGVYLHVQLRWEDQSNSKTSPYPAPASVASMAARRRYAKRFVVTMEKDKIMGGCYCGEVRFKAAPEVRVSTNCHCTNCRRAAGAQAVAWIIVKRSQFEFVKGTPRRYRSDTGAWRTFCDQRGPSLTYETDRRPDEIDITTGSLDHPEAFPPTKDAYPEERPPW